MERRNVGGIELIKITPKDFVVGGSGVRGGKCFAHKFTYEFYISIYPITERLWKQYMGTLPTNYQKMGDEYPITHLNWYDAKSFCESLNRSQIHDLTFRLPTEVEWEYCCTNGGTELSFTREKFESVAWYKDNSEGKVQEVGRKLPNSLGIYDMMGNVLQWGEDDFIPYPDTPQTDWVGVTEKQKLPLKVSRGSTWKAPFNQYECNPLIRGYMDANFPAPVNGCRIVGIARPLDIKT